MGWHLLYCLLVFLAISLVFVLLRMPRQTPPRGIWTETARKPWRKLLAVYALSLPDIERLAGPKAFEYGLFQLAALRSLVACAIPALAVVLPVNVFGGSGGAYAVFSTPASHAARHSDIAVLGFAATSAQHVYAQSNLLWLHVIATAASGVVSLVVVRRAENDLVRGRGAPARQQQASGVVDATEDLCSRSLLLTHLPVGADAHVQRTHIRTLLRRHWFRTAPASVYVPANRQAVYHYTEASARANTALERAIAGERLGWGTCWGAGVNVARRRALRLSARLQHERDVVQESPKSTGMAFVVFRDAVACRRARRSLKQLTSRRRYGVGLAPPPPPDNIESSLRPLRWHVRQAPPPDGIRWRNVGRSQLTKLARRIVANGAVLLVLVVSFSPQVVFMSLGSVAIAGQKEDINGEWQVLVSWADTRGPFAAFLLHFLPNVLVLLVLYLLTPLLLRRASRFECHAIRTHEERVLVSRMFFFFVLNLVVLSALNRAAIYSILHNVSSCFFPGGDEGGGGGSSSGGGDDPKPDIPTCESFHTMLSDSFIPDSSLVLTAFLLTAAFVGVPLDALSWWSWPCEMVRRYRERRTEAAETAVPLLGRPRSRSDDVGAPPVAIPSSASSLEMSPAGGGSLEQQPSSSSSSSSTTRRGSSFDYAASFAYSACIYAMAMWCAMVCPLALIPGIAYFSMRFVVDKYNFLVVYKSEAAVEAKAVASTDGRLAERGLNMLRISIVLQSVALLVFLGMRGTPEQRFVAALMVVCHIAYFTLHRQYMPSRYVHNDDGNLDEEEMVQQQQQHQQLNPGSRRQRRRDDDDDDDDDDAERQGYGILGFEADESPLLWAGGAEEDDDALCPDETLYNTPDDSVVCRVEEPIIEAEDSREEEMVPRRHRRRSNGRRLSRLQRQQQQQQQQQRTTTASDDRRGSGERPTTTATTTTTTANGNLVDLEESNTSSSQANLL